MKITKLAAVSLSLALAGAALAAAPAAPANPANANHTAHDMAELMKKYAEAVKKDTHQDAEGQKKLDEAWGKVLKAYGIDPKDPTAPKNPFVFEGSNKDAAQDAKLTDELNKWAAKHNLPPVSPIQ